MNLSDTLFQGHWKQWWAGDAAFLETFNTAAPNVYVQEEQLQYGAYAYDRDTSMHWTSPTTSMYSYPLPSPSSKATSIDIATGDSESRLGSLLTQTDKRKGNMTRSTAASNAPKRALSRKRTKLEATEKPKACRSKSKPAPQSQSVRTPSPEPNKEVDEDSKKVQERNRIASNKFRFKKREAAKRLRAEEQDMERANRDLSSCVFDLTMEVYDLKMRLLQHTDCDCYLIQDYIANEAHRYSQDLGDGKQTPATPSYTLINFSNATNELLLSESLLQSQETTMTITDEN
ncbi:hypothetical protein ACHAPD_006827 [Fusarium lateritium]